MEKYGIIVAGGKGLRMGADLPKQFLPLAGRPVLMHTLHRFFTYDPSIRLILVLPRAHQAYWKELCERYAFTVPHRIADGGATRFESVRNGLAQITGDCLVAVHDGVRPFVSADTIRACFDEAARSGAAIPVLPVTDTLREQTETGSRTVNRNRYCTVQTPQVFRSGILCEAYRQPENAGFTDDASVAEAAGYPVTLVPGNRENIKLTTPFDLQVGELLCAHARFR